MSCPPSRQPPMSAPQEQPPESASRSNRGGGYRRASRKGAPRRYACQFSGCDKIYSRQEHLQRHQLNHNPKEIFVCSIENCGQRFVRPDLLARHKKRHSETYTPRNHTQSFSEPWPAVPPQTILDPSGMGQSPGQSSRGHSGPADNGSVSGTGAAVSEAEAAAATVKMESSGMGRFGHSIAPPSVLAETSMPRPPHFPHVLPSAPRNATILLTPESGTVGLVSASVDAGGSAGPVTAPGTAGQSAATTMAAAATAWPCAPAQISGLSSCNTPHVPTKSSSSYFLPPHVQPFQPHQNLHHQNASRDQDHAPGSAAGPPSRIFPFTGVHFAEQNLSRDNFAMWLFDNGAGYDEFNVANTPFFEGGLESPFSNKVHYDYDSLASRSHMGTSPCPTGDYADEALTDVRHQELLQVIRAFSHKTSSSVNGDSPALPQSRMQDCLAEYWENISPRVPIIHQPTFSCNTCPPLLLLVMVSLGAASLYNHTHDNDDASGSTGNSRDQYPAELGRFADAIITNARWEILTTEDASPPVGLWVAQALLLLEFYEKMYSSRRLHERSHIYHSVTLTLLRRGSPLIGRSGSESPPGEMLPLPPQPPPLSAADNHKHLCQHHHHPQQQGGNPNLDWHAWWVRWAETEAMHRVVFAAFCFDITHAAMFGHAADMAPLEIRLPLPCDDKLWTAAKPNDVRQMDANLRMYGVKPISFLDGLKRALHGFEVKTHSFGRMIIMSGLLSVGWLLSHRETHLKWLDLTTLPTGTQESWRKILLTAFDKWKVGFDMVQRNSDTPYYSSEDAAAGPISASGSAFPARPVLRRGVSNGPIQSASVLYHLAHISLHVDIVDCQVYAGARQLLGRKVSNRDYANVVSRMRFWARQPSTRHAIWHAFRLLYRVLADPRKGEWRHTPFPAAGTGSSMSVDLPPLHYNTTHTFYSCKAESDPHRPWIMYYAALSIWAFVRALNSSDRALHSSEEINGQQQYRQQQHQQSRSQHRQYPRPQANSYEETVRWHSLHNPRQPQTYPQVYAHQQHHTNVAPEPKTGSYMHYGNFGVPHSPSSYERVITYLESVADLPELTESTALLLARGLSDLLNYLCGVLQDACSELLREALVRLKYCRETLVSEFH